MSSDSNSTFVLFAIIGALVSMAVGFVSIYSQIRGQGRQQKTDVENAKIELEKRIRDYLNLKLDNIETRMQHLKEEIIRLEKKIDRHHQPQQKDNDSYQ